MNKLYIKAVRGKMVRRIESREMRFIGYVFDKINNEYIFEGNEGEYVENNSFYRKMIKQGDLILANPPTTKTANKKNKKATIKDE